MRKASKGKTGDVIQIELPNGMYAYGRIYNEGVIGYYRGISSKPGEPPIGARDFVFHVGIYSDIIASGKTPIVGRDPFEDAESEWPPPMCIKDKISGGYSLYHKGVITKSTEEECLGLEPVAAWDLHHVINRIMANLESFDVDSDNRN